MFYYKWRKIHIFHRPSLQIYWDDKFEGEILLNTIKNHLDPFVYQLTKCDKHVFKKLERSLIHTCWPDVQKNKHDDLIVEDDSVEEDEGFIETNYCNDNNEVVKIFYQKCVICYERDSVYEFRKCGHQCVCEQSYQNKGDIDMIKYVVCRTLKKVYLYYLLI